jgi:hypothetical protein
MYADLSMIVKSVFSWKINECVFCENHCMEKDMSMPGSTMKKQARSNVILE